MGIFFLLPWIIGLLVFFIYPLIQTVIYSFHDVSFTQEGGGLEIKRLTGNLFEHYLFAFTKDAYFLQVFWQSIQKMLLLSPCIVIFSLFIAVILNQRFFGRTFMRAMFFLPVIVATGVITTIITQSLSEIARGGSSESSIFNSAVLAGLLSDSGIPENFVSMLTGIINHVVDLVWKSGIQILLLLGGLLGISPTYYEVAQVEGATKWESFWKVTFPLVLPYLLVTLVYTIIDGFTGYDNAVMRYIVDVNYRNVNFSYASALYWMYFIVALILIAVVYLLISKRSHYESD